MFLSTYPNYSFYQTKTTTSNGGSALYVLNSLAYAERKDLNTQIHGELETTFVKIEQNKKKNVICESIFGHPNSNIDDFIIYMINYQMRIRILYLWEILISTY